LFTFYLQAWLGEINEYAQEDVVIMLLGNKADMGNERMIRTEDGEKLARVNNSLNYVADCRGCDYMVVEFSTTCGISAYHH